MSESNKERGKKIDPHAIIRQTTRYIAQNYDSLPVVLSRGEGPFLYDVEGRQYFDFLSAYSAVNQGHVHPEIRDALMDQVSRLSLVSRAFHHDLLGESAAFISNLFEYEKVLMMNTGAEAVETALKLARKWGYEYKKIPENQVRIIVCQGNFHGRTSTIVSFSTDKLARTRFGPPMPGFEIIPYDDIPSLEKSLKHPHVAAFLVEPIQGEAGVCIPSDDYLSKVATLCKKHQVLWIADEIQTGLGRVGSWLGVCGHCTCQYSCQRLTESYLRPDLLVLGKALSGGMYPISAVLADAHLMDVLSPGTHGSTFGGNPIACRVARTALEVIKKENLIKKARERGSYFRERMQKMVHKHEFLKEVRGRGLLNALVLQNEQVEENLAYKLCLSLKEQGILAKDTRKNIIRFAPPLVISQEQMIEACDRIAKALRSFQKLI
ncbi:MAG: ornithine--oxo-acid transaminase [Cytophagales bacterium]|nr:ornithine--oxo-acid transaminase [Cytophagales bacterium]